MLRALLLTAALALPSAAFGQELAANFTPVFGEEPIPTGGSSEATSNFTPVFDFGPIRENDIVVYGERRPLSQETREEWRSSVESEVQTEPGTEYHIRTTTFVEGDGYSIDFRQITVRDRVGRNYGAGEPDDDTFRLVIPFPCEGCGED